MAHRVNLTPPDLLESDIKRFWSKLPDTPPGRCWTWHGTLNRSSKWPYGVFSVAGKPYRAHVISRFIATGEWPGAKFTCHSCDNTLCCNPGHLFLGDPIDNTRDMIRKGRHAHGPTHGSVTKPDSLPRGDDHYLRKHPEKVIRGANHYRHNNIGTGTYGEKCKWAKLNDFDVETIRRLYNFHSISLEEISATYGISRSHAHRIATGRRWKHIPMPAE